MASTNTFLKLLSTVQTNSIGSTINTGYIPYISTAGQQTYSNTLSTLTVSTISGMTNAPTTKRLVYTDGQQKTYTPTTAGVVRIKVRMCGGGGSGAAYLTNGNNGNATSFASWSCAGGGRGLQSGQGGAGGSSNGNSSPGTLIVRFAGGSGTGYQNIDYTNGGKGGSNPFGSGGGGGGAGVNGQNAPANTGCGGGGGGAYAANAGSGGGAGEYVEFYITNPTNYTINYTVGAGGNAVTQGVTSGTGANGIIIVEEFYI